nr:hypothetical protein [Pseudomonadota bacterium]
DQPSGAAIVMSVQVLKAGKGPMYYSMHCGTACHASADIGGVLRNEKGEGWFDLAIPLSCLKKSGANLASITRPVVLHTSSPWTLNLSTIRLDNPPEESRIFDCQ